MPAASCRNRPAKAKIEVVEYDDRSNSEEMIKAVERLATRGGD